MPPTTPQERLKLFAQRIHLSEEDVGYLLLLLAEAVRAEREASATAAWHAAALWEATRRDGADESVSEVVAAAVRGREV